MREAAAALEMPMTREEQAAEQARREANRENTKLIIRIIFGASVGTHLLRLANPDLHCSGPPDSMLGQVLMNYGLHVPSYTQSPIATVMLLRIGIHGMRQLMTRCFLERPATWGAPLVSTARRI